MGIKTTITPSQLPQKYQQYQLIPTQNGVMATVYLLDTLFVLKLFEENTTTESIINEIELLASLNGLPLPKVIDRFKIDEKEVIIYSQIQGEIIYRPKSKHIREIATFLKKFHLQSREISLSNRQLFSQERLKELIKSTKNQTLLDHFNKIDLTLVDNGIIHGDLFVDNCKFKNSKLSGVYDFFDACLGDFHFELAVVAISWCFDEDYLNRSAVETLLVNYGSNIDREEFDTYIKYALLYYTTTRFIAGRDYRELLAKLEFL
jgi:homoserine kinase type II